MTTAFAATLVFGPEAICPATKMAVYQIQMPDSVSAGGETCDVSGSMTYVQGGELAISGAKDELGHKHSVVGGTIVIGIKTGSLSDLILLALLRFVG